MKIFISVAILLLTTLTVNSRDTTNTTFGKGIVNVIAKDSSYSVKFGARFQALYISNWDITENNELTDHSSNMLIRRSRLKFNGFAYSPKLEYKLEIGLSNRDISGGSEFTRNTPRLLLDAVVKWNFYKNFVLWAGQTKLPGNRERVISSGDLQFVDRSLLNSNFNIDRDIGMQLRHHFTLGENFTIKEIVAISQGEGRNVTNENLGGNQWTYRLEFLPFGEFKDYESSDHRRNGTPKLAVGITYDYNDNAVKTRSNMGNYMLTDYGFYETDITTLFVDAMFKYQGISFMGEYANRDSENPIAENLDGSETGEIVNVGSGLNLQAAYLFPSNYEVGIRYTSIEFQDINNYIQQQYTFGLSKYIVGHKLKVQTDISYSDIEGNGLENLMYRLQFDFHL